MLKLAKIVDLEYGKVDVLLGTAEAFAMTEGYSNMEVEQAFDGSYYLMGFEPAAPIKSYAELRAEAYPEIFDQLDCLYHDINGGLLGETAKQSSFYLQRKMVKEEFPKPAEDVL